MISVCQQEKQALENPAFHAIAENRREKASNKRRRMKEEEINDKELDYIVLQGIPGGGADCLTNTIDSCPTISCVDPENNDENDLDERVISEWNETRRRKELVHRSEWLEETMAQHKAILSTESKAPTTTTTTANQEEEDLLLLTCETSSHWWFIDKQTGYLAILDGLPKRILHDDDEHDLFSSIIDYPRKIGMVPPGAMIRMAENNNNDKNERIITLNTRDLKVQDTSSHSNNNDEMPTKNGRKGQLQIMRIQQPMEGYIVASLHGYPYVTKFSKSHHHYHHPVGYESEQQQQWQWRVVCLEGAWIRQGLGLGTEYVSTAPYGATVSVHQKTVDTKMGLSRIRVSYSLLGEEEEETKNNDRSNNNNIETLRTQQRSIQGWASEYLNPLSGQRGPILCPIPFPRPAIYKVLEKCEIHETIEMESSRPIGNIPPNTLVPITGRAYTNRENATERLRLAGNGGWISRTRNITLDEDQEEDGVFIVTIPIAEFVRYDDNFDPWNPGRYHLHALRSIQKAQQNYQCQQEQIQDLSLVTTPRNRIRTISSSSDDDMGEEDTLDQANILSRGIYQEDASKPVWEDFLRCYYERRAAACPPAVDNNSVRPFHQTSNDYQHCCVICLSAERNATIVHGETGHVACCLACARILAARGDACPVCRKPIERVIEHFYA
jgi:E3 ubiquitin-protein ligase Mdm2